MLLEEANMMTVIRTMRGFFCQPSDMASALDCSAFGL